MNGELGKMKSYYFRTSSCLEASAGAKIPEQLAFFGYLETAMGFATVSLPQLLSALALF